MRILSSYKSYYMKLAYRVDTLLDKRHEPAFSMKDSGRANSLMQLLSLIEGQDESAPV